jgi:hypothetical protein
MNFCKVTIFKQFQEFFQPHDEVKCLKALEMLEMNFKWEISNLSCFQADAPFPGEPEEVSSWAKELSRGWSDDTYHNAIHYCH